MEKKEVLVKYKSAIISAIDLALDNIIDIEDLNSKDKKSSKDRYLSLRNKVENNEELTQAEYSLLSIICLNASNNLANSARNLLRSAESLQDLAKAFMA